MMTLPQTLTVSPAVSLIPARIHTLFVLLLSLLLSACLGNATVNAPVLTSIAITPGDTSLAINASQPFTATGTFSDGSSKNISDIVSWNSGNPATVSVDNTGLVKTIATGKAILTASAGNIRSNAVTVTVNNGNPPPAGLTSISITPSDTTLVSGEQKQLKATGSYSDGRNGVDISNSVTWNSSNPAVASIANGLVTGANKDGTSAITATLGTVTGSATVTVKTQVVLNSISITPGNTTLNAGDTQQLAVRGIYSDGSSSGLSNIAWSSSNAGIASVDSTGLAKAIATGSVTITATEKQNNISSTATITVNPPTLQSLTVTPPTATLTVGGTQVFSATGNYSDGTNKDITGNVTWLSNTAAVSLSGSMATANATGTATITASLNNSSGSATVTVNPKVQSQVLQSIAVTPANPRLDKGGTQQLTAIGTYSDGTIKDLSASASWSSSDTTSVSVGSTGLARAIVAGSAATVSAALQNANGQNITGFTTVNVNALKVLQSITVTNQSNTAATPPVAGAASPPGTLGSAILTMDQGTQLVMVAFGRYSDGSVADISKDVQWTSSNLATVSITNGVATANAVGTATLTAAMPGSGVTGNVSVTVNPLTATLQSIAVTPPNANLSVGGTQQLTATGSYSDGSSKDLSASVIWSSGDTAVASVTSTGLAKGIAAGTASVTATFGTISGRTSLTTTAATFLKSIAVTPANPTIVKGLSQQMTATGTYSDGTTATITANVTWTSGATTVATINATSGLLSAIATGTATVTATSGAISGNTTVTVNSLNVGGSVTGLASGASVVLQNNGAGNITMQADGTFNFAAQAANTAYNITVLTQPAAPAHACTVLNGAGTTSNANISVQVYCTTVVTTLAGSGSSGYADGTGTAATFTGPEGLVVDASGNVYVADTSDHRIRKITSAGVVTTLAGSTQSFADGTGTAAGFNIPYGVAVDAAGNVYVADSNNNRIRKITAAGVVTTLAGSGIAGFADGTGTAASFNFPYGVAVDAAGNVYIGDSGNDRIRKITAAGVVTTLAGGSRGFADGTRTAAMFYNPHGVAADTAGNVYVADQSNNRIRKITAAGVVTTLAGSGIQSFADGTGTAASFNTPYDVAVDTAGNVYVADLSNSRIRKITAAGVVTTLAGSSVAGYADGVGTAAMFYNPGGVAVDATGNIYVGDTRNNRIRKIYP